MGTGKRSNAPLPRLLRRGRESFAEHLDTLCAPLTKRMANGLFEGGPFGWFRYFPPVKRWSPPPVWPDRENRTPPELKTYAGVQIEADQEEQAFAEQPLHDLFKVHRHRAVWTAEHSSTWLIPTYPRLRRAYKRLDRAKALTPSPAREELDAQELSRRIREEGKRLGISEVGFAQADAKYTFAEYADPTGANVIVCILEQDFEATQTAPSALSERAAFIAYGRLAAREAGLVEFVKSLGYEARPNDFLSGEAMSIRYAVEAGLGQLGLNGQLLTPFAGSRIRISLITTNAPVALGEPVDFGIPRICDECQLCVRRCPVGAIPKTRRPKRGVVKAAIKTERCWPTMAQTHGCAVCMKVCPIQRYGLDAVSEHYTRTGTILGKGTDELEGYVWPVDGRYYGPGSTPRTRAEFFRPPGWNLTPEGPSEDAIAPAFVEVASAGKRD